MQDIAYPRDVSYTSPASQLARILFKTLVDATTSKSRQPPTIRSEALRPRYVPYNGGLKLIPNLRPHSIVHTLRPKSIKITFIPSKIVK